MPTLQDFQANRLDGRPFEFKDLQGKVVLVVNTASECGFTPQYAGLERLHRDYGPRGLVVLGFPCDQFGHQEPGPADQIERFCQVNYGVTFPLMAKVEVNGRGAHPLWRWLVQAAPGFLGTQAIKWNFTKFLIGRDGQVIERYAPRVEPSKLAPAIEAALSANPA